MQNKVNDSKFYISLLKKEIIPALGCTEPIALAYASAKVCEGLDGIPTKIDVCISGNIIKNVKGVIVPNTGGLRGVKAAIAVGCLSDEPNSKLELLNKITDAKRRQLPHLIDDLSINIFQKHDSDNLYIEVTGYLNDDYCKVIIEHKHTNITKIIKNDNIIFEKKSNNKDASDKNDTLHLMTFNSIYNYSLYGEIDELKDLLNMQLMYNREVAIIGLQGDYGLNVGKMLLQKGDCAEFKACAYAAAGSDARMSGCTSPVMINSGSGNQGMTLALPVHVYGESLNLKNETILRGLVMANLLSIYIKTNIGTLSAFCGAVSAAAGAGAAITYFKHGTRDQVGDTIKNCMSNLPGVICDGAKPSCAYKIASSVQNAIWASDLALTGNVVEAGSGVIFDSVDDTVKAIGRIGKTGMKATDDIILDIMTNSDN